VQKVIRILVCIAGVFLLVTAIAKLISATGKAEVLKVPDPILMLSSRVVFLSVGAIELIIAGICFFSRRLVIQAGLVAWIATSFFFYRLGLIGMGYHKPCKCLGNLTDALHIPPETADTVMRIVLTYLLFSSYAILFLLFRQRLLSAPSEKRRSA